MGFSLSKLWVEIGAKNQGFNRAIDEVESRMVSTKRVAEKFATQIPPNAKAASAAVSVLSGHITGMLGLLSVGAGVGLFFNKGIKGSVALNANLSKTEVIFGRTGDYIVQAADEMASKFGMVKNEYIEAATNFAAVFKGVGKNNDESVAMGNNLARLSADLASFSGKPIEQAMGAIGAALRGEMDPIEQFGVFLTQAEIEGEALRAGFAKTSSEIDTTAKKMAAYNLIMRQTGAAQGDLARTAADPDNQFKMLKGNLVNLATSIGTRLLPSVNAVVTSMNGWLSALSDLTNGNNATFNAIAEGAQFVKGVWTDLATLMVERFRAVPAIVESTFGLSYASIESFASKAYAVVSDFMGGWMLLWRNLPDFVDIAFIKINEVFINMGEWLSAAGQTAGNFAKFFGLSMLTAIYNVGVGIQNLAQNFYDFGKAVVKWLADPTQGFEFKWTGLTEGLQTAALQFPEIVRPHFTSLQDEIDRRTTAIGEREAKRLAGLADKAKETAAKQAAAKKELAGEGTPLVDKDAAGNAGKKNEFKSESYSGAEFARKLQSGLYGADKTPQKQLNALQQIQKATTATAKAVAKPKLAVLG